MLEPILHDFGHKIDFLSKNPEHRLYSRFEEVEWKRPHEIFECDYDKIFLFDTIEPNDVQEGILGKCYNMVALVLLSEYPDKIREMFVNKDEKANKEGIYGVTLYANGEPEEIIVDDSIPCIEENGKWVPLFSKPKGNELWVLIIEKAFAKLYGSYEVCEKGEIVDALEVMTSLPAIQFNLKTFKEEELLQ
eukprot:CAMPEP_0114579252 /NCGR_PEP_ID=MMETSP0125-20121206/3661_1 /TAXON_ID=485358 ORGANISM="Aristerostoma sp., Strain ATCC 50986" /NCGR_SAMPLE_ID=MMETSP0125 /ASSEMBLY_ACC=CAM_ASM_000245 /LENGTH=190 /DNA_ID=CAMNT_0001769875 /DNA_START=610 /DNA_END=1182 /DNA_ORIENTATION=-